MCASDERETENVSVWSNTRYLLCLHAAFGKHRLIFVVFSASTTHHSRLERGNVCTWTTASFLLSLIKIYFVCTPPYVWLSPVCFAPKACTIFRYGFNWTRDGDQRPHRHRQFMCIRCECERPRLVRVNNNHEVNNMQSHHFLADSRRTIFYIICLSGRCA